VHNLRIYLIQKSELHFSAIQSLWYFEDPSLVFHSKSKAHTPWVPLFRGITRYLAIWTSISIVSDIDIKPNVSWWLRSKSFNSPYAVWYRKAESFSSSFLIMSLPLLLEMTELYHKHREAIPDVLRHSKERRSQYWRVSRQVSGDDIDQLLSVWQVICQ